jgi:hypothetical protein
MWPAVNHVIQIIKLVKQKSNAIGGNQHAIDVSRSETNAQPMDELDKHNRSHARNHIIIMVEVRLGDLWEIHIHHLYLIGMSMIETGTITKWS